MRQWYSMTVQAFENSRLASAWNLYRTPSAKAKEMDKPKAVAVHLPISGSSMGAPSGTLSARLPMMQRGMSELQTLRIFYRISSGGYAKEKPFYVTKEACLTNFIGALLVYCRSTEFKNVKVDFHILCDACTPALHKFVVGAVKILRHRATALQLKLTVACTSSSYGNGAESFRHVFAVALSTVPSPSDCNTAIYFVEDDYLHVPTGISVVMGGLELAPYATGYDHPDKYTGACLGAVALGGSMGTLAAHGEGGGLVLCGPDRHYKTTHTTTMTFAAALSTLRADASIISAFVANTHPDDFGLFVALSACSSRVLVSPLPAASTHGETMYLSPYIAWNIIGQRASDEAGALIKAIDTENNST